MQVHNFTACNAINSRKKHAPLSRCLTTTMSLNLVAINTIYHLIQLSDIHLTTHISGHIKFRRSHTVRHLVLPTAASQAYIQQSLMPCVNMQSFLWCCTDFFINWHRLWWWWWLSTCIAHYATAIRVPAHCEKECLQCWSKRSDAERWITEMTRQQVPDLPQRMPDVRTYCDCVSK